MLRSVSAVVKTRPLLVVLAAVFAGLSVLLLIGAAVSGQPLVLMAAVPLAMTSVLMWYHGTGRLGAGLFRTRGDHRRRGRRRDPRTRRSDPRARRSDPRTTDGGSAARGDTWEVPFEEEVRRERRTRARRQARRSADDGGTSSRAAGSDRETSRDRMGGMTRAEAYDALGLEPTASDEEVRTAYRELAKTAHPDTDGGSAEAFQSVRDAYERLVEE